MLQRTLILAFFILTSQISFAQESDSEMYLLDELSEGINWNDNLEGTLTKLSANFKAKYGDAVTVCKLEGCKVEAYFEALAGVVFMREFYETDQLKLFKYLTSFFQGELKYIKSQGLDLMDRGRTPKGGKKPRTLFFSLYDAVASGLSPGVFSKASLAMAVALLDEGISIDATTGEKSKLGGTFGDHLMARFLGLMDDPMVDSAPIMPKVEMYREAFAHSFFTDFEWKGKALHTVVWELVESDGLYIMIDLDGLGYDLAKPDSKKSKGMNGLMVLGRSWYSAVYGESSEEEDQAMLDMLKRYSTALNMQDKRGNTALHYAALNGTSWYFEALLQAGADAGIKNKKGEDVEVILNRRVADKAQSAKKSSTLLGASANESKPYEIMLELLSKHN